jgi:ubiquitin carboxyl-terminal hydrolase 9/24
MLLAYSAATGKDNALNASIEKLHEMVNEVVQVESSFEIYQMCKEALEVLTVMFMLSPDILDSLIKENTWQTFVIDLLLICKEK